MSNFAFSQTKIGEYIVVLFAILGIQSAIVVSEMSQTKRQRNRNESDIVIILWIVLGLNIAMILTIIGNYQLFIRWQRTKHYIVEKDTLFNTGLYKTMLKEILCAVISPYPSSMT